MLTTNAEFLKNELMDVIRLFEGAENAEIFHTFICDGNNFINNVRFGDKLYEFCEEFDFSGELEFKRYAKRFAKLAVYSVLSREYNIKMPWGALTGIRPTKLAYSESENGRDYKNLFKKFGVSKENIALIDDILKAQQGVCEKREGDADLYIGIPFCPSKCSYCSFITADVKATEKFIPDYLSALVREIETSKNLFKRLKSVYIGGGTPLVLCEKDLEKVLSATAKIIPENIEYTVEAGRPDVFTDAKLSLLKDYGVNRICVNPQSFNDETLQVIGRKHTSADIYKAFEMSAKYNFSVNFDLIAGLADETEKDFSHSVDEAVRLSPENITVHTLCLKKGAKLKESESRLKVSGIEKMILYSREKLYGAGYTPYYLYRQKYAAGNCENTGWCKKGEECTYNIDVMEEITDNVACGANAVSKKIFLGEGRIERYGSPKDLKTYIEKIDAIIEEKRKLYL